MDDTSRRRAELAAAVRGRLSDIYAYFRRLGVDAATAEDLAQDTFILAWQGIANLRDETKLRSWLYGIAYRRYLQYRESVRPSAPLADDVTASSADDPGDDEHLTAQAIRAAVLALPAEYLHPVVLLYWEGISYKDAARALSLPIGTFAWRVHKAMKLLRRALAEKGADNDPVPQES